MFFLILGKFACKILIQQFSYAFPVNLTIPVSISLLIAACGLRNEDPCFYQGFLPDYLFFESPPAYYLDEFIFRQVCVIACKNKIIVLINLLRKVEKIVKN